MQQNETVTITLEGPVERDYLARALYNHYKWEDHQGHGEQSREATAIWELFQSVSGCHTLAEYEARRKLHLDSYHPLKEVHEVPR